MHTNDNRTSALDEPVILLDANGWPSGTAPKRLVHGPHTPLHLGFSCHVFDRYGRVLITRRAAAKATWPSVWTNACCGHPLPGETLRAAVARRLGDELGITARRMALAVSDFTYRAVMDNGVVEHEVCPVIVAEVDDEPVLNPAEVDGASWIGWDELCALASQQPAVLSPWSVDQIAHLGRLVPSPAGWLRDVSGRCGGRDGLDAPIGGRSAVGPDDAPGLDPLTPIRDDVDAVLRGFLAAQTSALVAVDPALVTVGNEISELIGAGGKRLRPAFVYWGHRAGGGGHDDAVAQVGAAVEMLHTFALLHDDVMDHALTRRGRAAACHSFRRTHVAEQLGGDADWFGTSAAILAGDVAFVWADQLLDTAPLDAATLRRARQVFTALRVEVMAGQYLDLRLDGAACADPEAARRVALLKSGRYTVTRPLELGLSLAGGGRAVHGAVAAYGDAIGLAFQLRDDVLGLLGDPATTGKSCTDDLRAGKRTLLILRAITLATDDERAFLRRCLGDRDLDDDAADRCRQIVRCSGALASVETLLRHQHAIAVDAVAALPQPARPALRALASMAVQRDH